MRVAILLLLLAVLAVFGQDNETRAAPEVEESLPSPTPIPIPVVEPPPVVVLPTPPPLVLPESAYANCFRAFSHCTTKLLSKQYGYEKTSREDVWQFIMHRTTGCEAELRGIRRQASGSREFPVESEVGVAVLNCIGQLPRAE